MLPGAKKLNNGSSQHAQRADELPARAGRFGGAKRGRRGRSAPGTGPRRPRRAVSRRGPRSTPTGAGQLQRRVRWVPSIAALTSSVANTSTARRQRASPTSLVLSIPEWPSHAIQSRDLGPRHLGWCQDEGPRVLTRQAIVGGDQRCGASTKWARRGPLSCPRATR